MRSPFIKYILLFLMAMGVVSLFAMTVLSGKFEDIPYDSASPVIYDNDEAIDVYTDDYLLALSSLGEIRLLGFITSSSVEPFNRFVSRKDFDRMIKERNDGLQAAKESGLQNIPKHVVGTLGHLVKPQSGRIEDTAPLGSDGSRLIAQSAAECSPERPLVLIMGGPLTVAADAYLLDPKIKDKVIVAWLGGRVTDMGDYNGQVDPWAAYIVLEKMRLVQFPAWKTGGERGAPSVPKERLATLPPSKLREWMIAKDHPVGLPGERDADAPPAIFMLRPDYAVRSKHLKHAIKFGLPKIQRSQTQRVSFSHWTRRDLNDVDVPAFKYDPNGSTLVIRYADKEVATGEWWRAITACLTAGSESPQ
jgi:hypothetical protein